MLTELFLLMCSIWFFTYTALSLIWRRGLVCAVSEPLIIFFFRYSFNAFILPVPTNNERRGSNTIDERCTKIIQSCYNNCITKHGLLEISRLFRWSVRQWLPVRLLCQIPTPLKPASGSWRKWRREGEKKRWLDWCKHRDIQPFSIHIIKACKLYEH